MVSLNCGKKIPANLEFSAPQKISAKYVGGIKTFQTNRNWTVSVASRF